LDDDQINKTYVNRTLGDWRDIREFTPTSDDWIHDGTVEITNGNIWMGWKAGTIPKSRQLLGIVLDLGAQENYAGFSLYMTARSHQETLLYPTGTTSSHTGGYLLSNGAIGAAGALNNASPANNFWVSGTAYAAGSIVITSAGNNYKGYYCTSSVPLADRGTEPQSNPDNWDEIVSPISGIIGTAVNSTDLNTFANRTGDDIYDTFSPSFGRNLLGFYNGAWMTAGDGAVRRVKDLGVMIPAPQSTSRYAVVVVQFNWYFVNDTPPALKNAYGVNITNMSVYGDASYSPATPNDDSNSLETITTNLTSTMPASTPIQDVVRLAAPRISTSGVQTTSTALQDFKTDGFRTPREVIEQANAYHGWIARVGADRELTFKPVPTVPRFEIGSWSGYEFQDQAATTSEDIYTRVIVEATGPDGNQLRVIRSAAMLADAVRTSYPASTLSNAQKASIVVQAITPPDVTPTATTITAKDGASININGVFRAGVTYQFSGTIGQSTGDNIQVQIGTGGYTTVAIPSGYDVTASTLDTQTVGTDNVTGFQFSANASNALSQAIPFTATWTPTVDQDYSSSSVTAAGLISVSGTGGGIPFTLSNFKVQILGTNLAERRGVRRTYALAAPGTQTTTTLAAIGDAWLWQHLRAQFRGNVTVTGSTAIRQYSTGDAVHPSRMLLEAGELIRLSDRLDPDTGGLGRGARITAVTYDHDAQFATLELDNRRDNLQTFLNRLAVM
jgi:hypothetical protein